ncbi:hypothetical protein [Rhodopila globiformis]|jgi:hypothetical protein|uniref:hypothetical protein n=1 Tax=Rhodopila globiformis TaxID=1071 RepID=UPI001304C767|nr:hypothetical protein [Rhodopila globiformis]
MRAFAPCQDAQVPQDIPLRTADWLPRHRRHALIGLDVDAGRTNVTGCRRARLPE